MAQVGHGLIRVNRHPHTFRYPCAMEPSAHARKRSPLLACISKRPTVLALHSPLRATLEPYLIRPLGDPATLAPRIVFFCDTARSGILRVVVFYLLLELLP